MVEISFLIPTCNRPQMLKEALESLILQTNCNWEAIVIDDSNASEAEGIVKNFNDTRIKYFKNTGIAGAAGARNFAAQKANAPIIAILDDDDLAYPARVEETLRAFKDSSCDLVYADLDIWDVEKDIVRARKTPVQNFDLEVFKKIDFIPHGTVALKKEIFLENLYDPQFKMAEDYDLLSRLAVKGLKFVYIHKKLLKYRLWSGNTTSAKKQVSVDYYTKLVQKNRGW